jgi:hypothetical protein
MKSGVRTRDNLGAAMRRVNLLSKRDVLVGVPAANAARIEKGQPINNAVLGYIHEYGAPAAGIPARPHLIPGIRAANPKIVSAFRLAAKSALRGNQESVDDYLEMAGIVAVASVKSIITAGIAPPLTDATLKARARRVKSRAAERIELAARAAGEAPSVDFVKPLIDTGGYYNSITYVVAKK